MNIEEPVAGARPIDEEEEEEEEEEEVEEEDDDDDDDGIREDEMNIGAAGSSGQQGMIVHGLHQGATQALARLPGASQSLIWDDRTFVPMTIAPVMISPTTES